MVSRNLPNYLSSVRIVLSPAFLVTFFLPIWSGHFAVLSVVLCWVFMFLMDISDILDGYTARKLRLVSDFGKMFDPYTDLFARLTYFLCFAGIGRMPVWMLAIIIYREISVTFMRTVMMGRGFAMGARLGGKIKEWVYAFSAIFSMLALTLERTGIWSEYSCLLWNIAMVFYVLSAIFAVITFFDYLIFLNKKNKERIDKGAGKGIC
ncbi:MAG: CDP-diacylglycerol--glycerol-3-phosphate 3-phosphatidyltransferase [Spirochaetia bacterium]|nr:CDP-diacylglycerol--glycerol-3-phosphate 3-phosphatidyltransferase [Spirochaetia bacterium]